MSTSPLAVSQHVQQQRELARASHQLEQYEDTWVTGGAYAHWSLGCKCTTVFGLETSSVAPLAVAGFIMVASRDQGSRGLRWQDWMQVVICVLA